MNLTIRLNFTDVVSGLISDTPHQANAKVKRPVKSGKDLITSCCCLRGLSANALNCSERQPLLGCNYGLPNTYQDGPPLLSAVRSPAALTFSQCYRLQVILQDRCREESSTVSANIHL